MRCHVDDATFITTLFVSSQPRRALPLRPHDAVELRIHAWRRLGLAVDGSAAVGIVGARSCAVAFGVVVFFLFVCYRFGRSLFFVSCLFDVSLLLAFRCF